MICRPKRAANGSMIRRGRTRKVASPPKMLRVARQHSLAADDSRNYTAPHPEQIHWSLDNLPDILYQLRPLDTGVHEQNVGVRDTILYGNRLRDLPVLPDHISSNVEEWRVEAWMRLDKRVRLSDITDRMHPEFRISNNTLQQRGGRFRQDFHLISWYSGNRKSADLEARVIQKLHEKGIDPALNSTRGLTPGLINPELGERSSRVPLPPNWAGLKISRAPRRKTDTTRNAEKWTRSAVAIPTKNIKSADSRHITPQPTSIPHEIQTPTSNSRSDSVQQQLQRALPPAASDGPSIIVIGGPNDFLSIEQVMTLIANGILPTQGIRSLDETSYNESCQQLGICAEYETTFEAASHADWYSHTSQQSETSVNYASSECSSTARFPLLDTFPSHEFPTAMETPLNNCPAAVYVDPKDLGPISMPLGGFESLAGMSNIKQSDDCDQIERGVVDDDLVALHAALAEFAVEPCWGMEAYKAKLTIVSRYVAELQTHLAHSQR